MSDRRIPSVEDFDGIRARLREIEAEKQRERERQAPEETVVY